MPRIWCSISGHGFGHGAQTIWILNELGSRLPDVHVLLRTNLPRQFLEETLAVSWEHYPSIQDIGCVQEGPLLIDVQKTWIEYERFQFDWSKKVGTEAEMIQSHKPDLVISNISFFGVEAGEQAGFPTIAMGSLSWDRVLQNFQYSLSDQQRRILDQICHSYQKAQLMIRFAPALPMPAFRNLVDVGPIVGPALQPTGIVRELLKMQAEEKLVLVAFGGIRLESLPLEKLESLPGYRFLVYGTVPHGKYSHVSSITCLPVPFRQIFAEADCILTKPGYATVIEAVRNAIPIVYVRRFNFVDEQILVDYAHRHGRARELPSDQFKAGEWLEALQKVQQDPFPLEAAAVPGTSAAVEILTKFL